MTILTPPPGRAWDFSDRRTLTQGLTLAQASRAYMESAKRHYRNRPRMSKSRLYTSILLSSKG